MVKTFGENLTYQRFGWFCEQTLKNQNLILNLNLD